MNIVSISVQNFFTFENATLDLSKCQGLWLIEGHNYDDSGCDDNGSGKSTILTEAPAFALFGTSFRYGKHLDDVVNNRHNKDCRVEVIIQDGDNTLAVTRFRKHKQHKNSLWFTINDKDCRKSSDQETQLAIEQALGFNFATFMATSMISQEQATSFSAATDSEKKEIMETILGLEKLSTACELSREKLAAAKQAAQMCTMTASNSERTIQDIKARIADITVKMEQAAAESAQALEEATTAVKGLEEKVQIASKAVAGFVEAKSKIAWAEVEAKQVYADLDTALAAKKSEYTATAGELRAEAAAADRSVSKLTAELTTARSKIDRPCPTCGKIVTDADMGSVVASIESQLKEAKAEQVKHDELRKALGEVYVEIQNEEAAMAAPKKKFDDAHLETQRITDKITEAQYALKNAKSELDMANRNITSIRDRKTPYEDMLAKEQVRAEEAQGSLASAIKGRDEANQRVQDLEFWVVGFGNAGIKSLLLDNVVGALNSYANKYSKEMTEGSITVGFQTQSETRGGKTTDKFNVTTENRFGSGVYVGNSGGEKKRVDLCVLMALQKVAPNRNLEQAYYDEVTSWLDPIGCERFMRLLRGELAAKSISSAFVIAHEPDLKPYADGVIVVEKRGGVSSLKPQI